jgi:hypothetical protein
MAQGGVSQISAVHHSIVDTKGRRDEGRHEGDIESVLQAIFAAARNPRPCDCLALDSWFKALEIVGNEYQPRPEGHGLARYRRSPTG